MSRQRRQPVQPATSLNQPSPDRFCLWGVSWLCPSCAFSKCTIGRAGRCSLLPDKPAADRQDAAAVIKNQSGPNDSMLIGKLASSFQSNRHERWASATSLLGRLFFLLTQCLERVGVGTELTKILG